MSEDNEYARLKWRCRRGMLELDLLLLPFIEQGYPVLTAAEKRQFHTLLDLEDQDLLEYLMQQRPPEDASLTHVISKIRNAV